jgi:hypothetical protein
MRVITNYLSLPGSLLFLVLSLVTQPLCPAYAQPSSSSIVLDRIASFSITSTTRSLTLSIPPVGQPVVMSIELCTQVSGQQRPRFFVVPNVAGASSSTTRASSTSSSASAIPSIEVPSGGVEVDMGNGLGTWNSIQSFDNGGTLQVRTSLGATTGTWDFQVGLSTSCAYLRCWNDV